MPGILSTLPVAKFSAKRVDGYEMAVFGLGKNKGYTVMSNYYL